MDILVRKTNNIVAKSGTITIKPVRDMYYIAETQTHIQYIDRYWLVNDITLPEDFESNGKYKYNPTDGFYLNEDWEETFYLEPYVRENRDRIKTLESQMAHAIQAIQNLQNG